jgi:GT2 family glycosyltransferase
MGKSMIDNAFITACLRSDYVGRMVETLYTYTPDLNFKVIVIDQTLNGLSPIKGVHMVIRPYRNLGFSKAMNEGIIHALHWKSEFITCINDDVEFINKRWWSGIMDTFNMESKKEILAVAPESPRIPLWGYGDTKGNYVEVIPYKENFTEADYDYLMKGDFSDVEKRYPDLPKTFPDHYTGVCDAIAAWGPVCKRKLFTDIGLWDERFYPGGAEDYDMMGRIYSKEYRAVSTRKSWVWHWWGKSKDSRKEVAVTGLPIEKKYGWADLSYLWPKELNQGKGLDVWGHQTDKNGVRHPCQRLPEIGIIEI